VAIATVPGVAHLGSVPGDKFISATGAFPDGVRVRFLPLHTRSVTIEISRSSTATRKVVVGRRKGVVATPFGWGIVLDRLFDADRTEPFASRF
jgi:hypothetical protein